MKKLLCWLLGHKEVEDFHINDEDFKAVQTAMKEKGIMSGVAIHLLCSMQPSYQPYVYCQRCKEVRY